MFFSKKKEKNIEKTEEKNIKNISEIYEKAKGQMNNQILNVSKALHVWKLLAFICLIISATSIFGVIYLSTRSTLIPYVIEVDSTGNAKAINPAYQKNYNPNEENIMYCLREFIRNARWISSDEVLETELYSRALNQLTPEMKTKLRNISSQENLKDMLTNKYTRDVEIKSIVKMAGTESTYQIKWKETLYTDAGSIIISPSFVGLFTITIEQPKTLGELEHNPLGLYIKDFNFGKDKE